MPNPVELSAGGDLQLAAEVDDDDGQPVGGASIVFLSGDPAKLAISSTGFVRSEGPAGEAQILARSGDKQIRVPVKITAGPVQKMKPVGGDEQIAPVGTYLPSPLMLRIFDARSNPVSGSTVTFLPMDGGLAEPESSVTNTNGEVSARWKLGARAGAQTLSASIGGTRGPSVTFSAHGESGPPTMLSGTAEPGTVAPGEVRHALAVNITDANGNPKNGIAVKWRLETSGGKLSNDTSASDESGTARVILSTSPRSRGQRVSASAADLVTVIAVPSR